MSVEQREALVAGLIFQADSQRSDLLDISLTNTNLIALLRDLQNTGHILEITSVRTDHGDDSGLGYHCHANGFCVDCWPLNSPTPGDYMDASTHDFRQFLRDAASSVYLWQIGLVGDGADSQANFVAAGPTAFQDDGGPHVHLGANG